MCVCVCVHGSSVRLSYKWKKPWQSFIKIQWNCCHKIAFSITCLPLCFYHIMEIQRSECKEPSGVDVVGVFVFPLRCGGRTCRALILWCSCQNHSLPLALAWSSALVLPLAERLWVEHWHGISDRVHLTTSPFDGPRWEGSIWFGLLSFSYWHTAHTHHTDTESQCAGLNWEVKSGPFLIGRITLAATLSLNSPGHGFQAVQSAVVCCTL